MKIRQHLKLFILVINVTSVSPRTSYQIAFVANTFIVKLYIYNFQLLYNYSSKKNSFK